MQAPELPDNETQRIALLHSLQILDSAPEERFDRLTRLARKLFDVPIALVSLVDSNRQWFKSKVGLDVCETSREISFCGHAILQDDVFVVPDATRDERFHDNPLVLDEPAIRFYAGVPLAASPESKLGTLCLIDTKPRELDDEDRSLLEDLASIAAAELVAVQLNNMDDLTDLSNRRGFLTLSRHALSVCQRVNRPASLLYLDLDQFKPINDQFGHPEGDRALKAFARLLKDNFRDSDVIGRIGGDEFVVFLTSTETTESRSMLKRFNQALAAYNQKADSGYDLRYSVGTVTYDPERHVDLEDLMAEADRLMYAQKAGPLGARTSSADAPADPL